MAVIGTCGDCTKKFEILEGQNPDDYRHQDESEARTWGTGPRIMLCPTCRANAHNRGLPVAEEQPGVEDRQTKAEDLADGKTDAAAEAGK